MISALRPLVLNRAAQPKSHFGTLQQNTWKLEFKKNDPLEVMELYQATQNLMGDQLDKIVNAEVLPVGVIPLKHSKNLYLQYSYDAEKQPTQLQLSLKDSTEDKLIATINFDCQPAILTKEKKNEMLKELPDMEVVHNDLLEALTHPVLHYTKLQGPYEFVKPLFDAHGANALIPIAKTVGNA